MKMPQHIPLFCIIMHQLKKGNAWKKKEWLNVEEGAVIEWEKDKMVKKVKWDYTPHQ